MYEIAFFIILLIVLIFIVRMKYDYFVDGFENIDEKVRAMNENTSAEESILDRLKRYFGLVKNKEVYLDGTTKMDDNLELQSVKQVEMVAENLKIGACVDLYKMTGNPFFMTKRDFSDDFYDVKFCVDNEGDGSIDRCSIGRFVFEKNKGCWTYKGRISEIASNVGLKWDFRPQSDQGMNDKAPIETCPFPEKYCLPLHSFFNDNMKGYKTFEDGAKFYYDGRYIKRMI